MGITEQADSYARDKESHSVQPRLMEAWSSILDLRTISGPWEQRLKISSKRWRCLVWQEKTGLGHTEVAANF